MTSGFNFWMVVGPAVMCVDNVNVSGMDFSSLPSNVAMIQWREGRGEIELTTGPALRTAFYDVTPYTALFQQFMTLLSGLTLAQAQQIQSNLVAMLYEHKRQMPFNFTVSAGDFNWSTLDADIAAMAIETIPFVVAAIAAGTGSSGSSLAALATQINVMIDQLNAALQQGGPYGFTGSDTYGGNAASPGLSGNLPHVTATGGTGSGSANIPWTPLGQNNPVNLTLADMTNLMSGISSRRSTLLTTMNTKNAAIAALTAISDVIAFSVTAGW